MVVERVYAKMKAENDGKLRERERGETDKRRNRRQLERRKEQKKRKEYTYEHMKDGQYDRKCIESPREGKGVNDVNGWVKPLRDEGTIQETPFKNMNENEKKKRQR
jgi:hypothetical protein